MQYQNANSPDIFLVVVAFIVLVIFIMMLLAAFMIVRSNDKTRNEAGAENERESRLAAGGDARLFAQDQSKGERQARQSEIVGAIKTLNWGACCIIASIVAFLGYDHVQRTLLPLFQIPVYYYWSAYILAILSPVCIAVAWLRLTGIRWRWALRLFLIVPLGAYVIWYIVNIVPYWLAN